MLIDLTFLNSCMCRTTSSSCLRNGSLISSLSTGIRSTGQKGGVQVYVDQIKPKRLQSASNREAVTLMIVIQMHDRPHSPIWMSDIRLLYAVSPGTSQMQFPGESAHVSSIFARRFHHERLPTYPNQDSMVRCGLRQFSSVN